MKYYLPIFFLVLFSCSEEPNLSKSARLVVQETEHGTKQARVPDTNKKLQAIRERYSKYFKIKLPFECASSTIETIRTISTDETADALLFGEDRPGMFIGALPDTTNYFGFLYVVPADEQLLSLITFNKKGELLEQCYLVESCWHGCESDCRYWFNMDRQLKMQFRYEEFLFDFEEDYSYCAELPESASGYVRYMHLNKEGRLVETRKDALQERELLLNPMIHKYE